MPKRQNVFEVPADIVQGEDSFVRYRAMNYKRSKLVAAKLAAIEKNDELAEDEKLDRQVEISEQLLIDYIVDWNWVDDDGKPLPLPSADREVLDRLTNEEVTFLSSTLNGKDVEKKVSVS